MGREELTDARKALNDYREKSLCGYCREYAGTMIDTLDAMIDIDKNMEQIVATKMNHPKMASMPSLSKTMQGLRQKSGEMLNGTENAKRAGGISGRGLGLRDMAKDMRGNIGSIVPRPGTLFRSNRRR